MSETVWLPCPFCTGTIAATREPPAALHSVPPCDVFIAADDALDFVQKCNAAVMARRQVRADAKGRAS
jgi:hypothetical protein